MVPQVQELFQSEQCEWDIHNHTCQHPEHCKLQYQVDNPHPAFMKLRQDERVIILVFMNMVKGKMSSDVQTETETTTCFTHYKHWAAFDRNEEACLF